MTDGRNLASRGLNFMTLGGATHILASPDITITATSKALLPLLAGRLNYFKEALKWIQLDFTGDREGAYMVPASMVLVWFVLVEWEPIFAPVLDNLWRCFPRAYPPPDYNYAFPLQELFIGSSPKCLGT